MAESDERFASRWSRRKRDAEVKEPAEPLAPAGSQGALAESEAPAAGLESNGNLPESETVEVPDPDTLDADADFTVFLKDGVPEAIRRRALRRLWRLNPVFANLDGLNDYDDDFTDAATVVEGLKTLYQVGKGFVVDEDEKAEEAVQSESEAETAAEGVDEPLTEDTSLLDDEAGTEPLGLDSHTALAPVAEKVSQNLAPEPGNHRRSALARRWGNVSD